MVDNDTAYKGLSFEHSVLEWRKKISKILLRFLSVFGLIAYIPSVMFALGNGYYEVAIIDTAAYILCLYLSFAKRISHTVRSILASIMLYGLGVMLLLILGAAGAGELWLFSFTLVAGLLLGDRGAVIAFLINGFTFLVIFILSDAGIISLESLFLLTYHDWLAKVSNFFILNFLLVLSNYLLFKGFAEMLRRSNETNRASILGLAKLAEYRDSDTGEHLDRIQFYTKLLATGLGKVDKYKSYITPDYIEDIRLSSILHDIGKVGINDAILLKPQNLNEKEYQEIKHHSEYGGEVIVELEKNIDGRSFYELGREIAFYHHEKWDGSGYPSGKKGYDIPLSARIVALADVYDALTSKRCYKDAHSHDEAVDIIKKGKGSHFDPEIVDVFLSLEDRMKIISQEKRD